MSGAENEADADPPLTVELLADLQAGLLDDDAAARVRQRVRTDPEAESILRGLNQVRRDVAAAAFDVSSAPEAPPAVAARISAALRSAPRGSPGPAHSARPQIRRVRVLAGIAGLCAVVAAIGVGTAVLVNAPTPMQSEPTTAEHITVSTPPAVIPLSEEQILGLLNRAPDFGPLSDAPRRVSCLSGLGYPASTPVLGAQPVNINARPGLLLVVPGDTPDKLAVFAVALDCGAADAGLLAATWVPRA